ncbi:MAG: Holliday junction branch migration protein RuvA [Coriobacteriia bacterium]|nr:Holliday junction branch migration protein RuvA [Coriobacteriia bacterium]
MIAFLQGTVAGRTPQSVLLNVNGVGFEVLMSSASLSKLPAAGEQAVVQTYLQVREDAMTLFGFLSAEEKSLFERLIGVTGVGPKMALAALSLYSPAQLVDAIMQQDVARVQKVPGVGKKTASRIILELKGTLEKEATLFDAEPAEDVSPAEDGALAGAKEALLSLGFTSAEADLACKGAPAGASEGALLQYALKRLGAQ